MNSLQVRAADHITLETALRRCAAVFTTPAIALLYTPQEFLFARCAAEGELTNARGETIPYENIYEARVFDEQSELRWLNTLLGEGRACLLSTHDITDFLERSVDEFESQPIVATNPQTYLLWGQGVAQPIELASGWSRLTMARIGRLDVPLAGIQPEQRALLHAVEYLSVVDDYGNVAVLEERLVKLDFAEVTNA